MITPNFFIKVAYCLIVCLLLLHGPLPACPVADISGDCLVDIEDLSLMASQWLDSGPIPANLDGLGEVDLYDLAILAGDWGQSEGTGSVTVTIADPIPTGAQWQVDGSGPWYNSGDTASGISVGAHTITFADVAGYTRPADEPVNVPYGGSTTTETFVTMSSSVWEYLYDGSDQGTGWRDHTGDGWDSGPGQLGFNEGDENTNIGPRVSGRRMAYFRHEFSVSNVSEVTALTGEILHDDGAVIYLNDQEVDRIYMPTGTIDFETLAATQGENTTSTISELSPSFLDEGNNIIAVEVHQKTDNSSDISFDLSLEATRVIGGSGPAAVNAGAYAQQTGTLVVTILPQVAIDDGAQWRVDGGSWRDSGVEITLAVGTHTVEFSSVFGWQKPSTVQVDVFDALQAVVKRSYSPAPTAGVQINEFMSDNDSRTLPGSNPDDPLDGATLDGSILDGDLMSSDWIELYNMSASPIDISEWYLTDEADQKTKWQFPAGMSSLQPGGYLLVFASGKIQEENPGNYPYWDGTYYHTNFGLDNGGEYLALIGGDGTTVIHEFNKYPDQEENYSYGLDGSDASYFSVPTPGSANTGAFVAFVEKPDVNIDGGCYETAVDVTLSCDTVGAAIYYTTDGSDPSPTTGSLYTGPIHLDSLTALVAKGFRTGFEPSKARIETYIFLQSGLAAFNSNLPIIIVDTMGEPIIQDSVNKPWAACRTVIVDVDKITGRASITGPEHFAGLGAIRYRGESTYGTKRNIAFEVQDEYGMDKEVSLLGMPAESDWIITGDKIDRTLLKKSISFNWFQSMGHWAPRLRYVEMYVNEGGGATSEDDYKGIFMMMEKIKRDDNRLDIGHIDVLHDSEPQVSGGYIIKNDKADTDDTVIVLDGIGANESRPITIVEPDHFEITQPQIDWIVGYMNEFNSVLWEDTDSDHYPDPLVNPNPKYSDYVDVASWIDHFIVEQIGHDNDSLNISYYIHKPRGEKIHSGPPWDFDRAFINGSSTSYKLDEYDVWRNGGGGLARTHSDLDDYLDYRMTFADRWFQHRETFLSTAASMAYIDETVALISEAMARSIEKYGGFSGAGGDYAGEIGLLKTWITNRLDWLDGEIAIRFAEAPPTLSPVGGYINSGNSVSMTKPSGVSGTIYYTVNGEDPRTEGGGINPNVSSGSSVTLNKSTCVKARVKDGGDWTAMNTEVYAVGPVLESLRISELMYHPTDPTASEIAALDPDPTAEDFEYIEVKNIGGVALNLNLVHFTDGIDFTCGDYTLAADSYAVLVRNQAAFAERYGTSMNIVPGSYLGTLDNGGEEIVLRDALGAEIHDFDYKDSWYELTDGVGYSLTMVDPASPDPNMWDTKAGWRSSLYVDGTPGQAPETVLAADSIVINEVLAHSHAANPDWVELHNTTGTPIDIAGWFFTDDDSSDINIWKYEFQNNSIIPANGYLTLTQDTSFGNIAAAGCTIPFGLSEGGETVYLYSGAAGAVTGFYQTQQKFDASETDVTFGRYEKAELSGGYDFVRQSSATPDAANSGPLIPDIVITEIHYNPPSGVDYEFVELYNRTGSAVTLETEVTTETSPGNFTTEDIPWRLEGTGYEFPLNTTIPADTRILVAKVPAKYSSAPCTVYGPYDGKLDNGGEEVELQIPGDQEYGQGRYWIPIEKIDYDDIAPWPTTPDGGGDSLQRGDINAYSRDYSNWNPATPTPGS